MDKFLTKRTRSETGGEEKAEDSPTKKSKKTSTQKYLFVIGPGAGGGDSAELTEVLSTLGRTVGVKKWVGNFPAQMPANVALLEEAASGAQKKGETVVFCGHSFGCRVVAAILKERAVPAVLESYPLFGPSKPKNKGTDRVAPLKEIPSDRRILFVNGTKDPFLARDWQEGPKGIDALRAVLDDAPFASTCVAVDGAGHNVLKVAKSKQLANRGILRSAVQAYLDSLQ